MSIITPLNKPPAKVTFCLEKYLEIITFLLYYIHHSFHISYQMDDTLTALESSSRCNLRRNAVPREMDTVQFERQCSQCTVSIGRPSK
jgi:hypothetical protein